MDHDHPLLDLDRFALLDSDTSVFPKEIRPGALLVLPDAVLKWYDIATSEVDLTALAVTARAFLASESAARHLVLEDSLGFVELHHCGSFAFLIVSTWKRNNELWTTTYWIGLGQEVPIVRRVSESVAGHRPNLCIWEMVPVWHERNAWIRYIGSARDDAAKRAYLADTFTGTTDSLPQVMLIEGKPDFRQDQER